MQQEANGQFIIVESLNLAKSADWTATESYPIFCSSLHSWIFWDISGFVYLEKVQMFELTGVRGVFWKVRPAHRNSKSALRLHHLLP